MEIITYILSVIVTILGVGFLTNADKTSIGNMSKRERVIISLILITGAGLGIIFKWYLILIAVVIAASLYNYFEYKRRNKRATISKNNYKNSQAFNQFLDSWLLYDPQVSEIRRESTYAIWNEGFRPPESNSKHINDPEEYFRQAFKKRLIRLQDATEKEWIDEIEKTGDKSFSFVKTTAEVSEKYGIDPNKFNYKEFDKLITDKSTLNKYKQAFLAERLLSNQRRLLMWLFHERFDKWYTPQNSSSPFG